MKSVIQVLNNAVATEGFDIPVFITVVGDSSKCLYYKSIAAALINHRVIDEYEVLSSGFMLDNNTQQAFFIAYVQQSS